MTISITITCEESESFMSRIVQASVRPFNTWLNFLNREVERRKIDAATEMDLLYRLAENINTPKLVDASYGGFLKNLHEQLQGVQIKKGA